MWSSFLAFFVLFLEQRYEEILSMIRNLYLAIRDRYEGLFEDLRPVDQLTQMHLAFDILEVFLQQTSGCENNEAVRKLIEECQEACCLAVRQSQDYAVINSGENQYIFAVAKLIFDKTIVIAEKRKIYAIKVEDFDGFEDDTYYYLRADAIYAKVRRYFYNQGRELAVSQINAGRALDRAGLIEVEVEHRGSSRERRLFEIKVLVGEKRPRMLKINKKIFEEFVAGQV